MAKEKKKIGNFRIVIVGMGTSETLALAGPTIKGISISVKAIAKAISTIL